VARATLLATDDTADRRAMVDILLCLAVLVSTIIVVVVIPRNPIVEQFAVPKNVRLRFKVLRRLASLMQFHSSLPWHQKKSTHEA
jgi:hypothetical protein